MVTIYVIYFILLNNITAIQLAHFGDEVFVYLAMSYIGTIGPFDEGEEEFDSYIDRMKLFFKANEIKPTDPKYVPAFLSLIGAKTYKLLKDLITPKEPAAATFDELITALKKHYKPQVVVIYERFKFYNRNQLPNESVSDFIAGIKHFARTCEFGEALNQMLRDRLVMGLRDESTQRALLTVQDLTFADAFRVAIAREKAAKDVGEFGSKSTTRSVNYVNSKKSNKTEVKTKNFIETRDVKKHDSGNSKNSYVCFGCGQGHFKKDCPFRNARCHQCNGVGHIRKVCRSKTKPKVKTSVGAIKEVNEIMPEYIFHNNDSTSDPYIVNLKLNNVSVPMELDTGAGRTLMPFSMLNELFSPVPKIQSCNVQLKLYNKANIKVIGSTKVNVDFNGNSKVLTMIIVSDEGPTLLGRDWIRRLGLKNLLKGLNETSIINSVNFEVFSEFPKLFKDELGEFNKYKVSISIDKSVSPKFCNARPVPYAMRDKVDVEIDRLLKQKIIEPVANAKWAAPIVPVMKPDNSVRLCGDYRLTANKAVLIDSYPLPKPEVMFSTLAGGKLFSKLDLSQAYAQLQLDDDSKELTVINTHRGLFRYNRLCFGVSCAPGIFQRVMEQLLRDIPGVLCYLDDILVTGSNIGEHDYRLKLVFSKLQEAGLKLKSSKCSIGTTQVNYLGFCIDAKGIHPTDDKLLAIKNAPAPTNVTQLQSYLGMLNFYRRFVKDISSILEPLNKLLRKDVKWVWGTEEKNAFEASKTALLNSKALVHFDPKLPIVVTADSSSYGLGAVLAHVVDGHERPVCFVSRTLNTAERNYSQIEREALSLIFALKKFHFYLYGQRFTLVTDHKPLLSIFSNTKNIPIMASGRIQRWCLMMQAYHFSIVHKSGVKLGTADALSRLPLNVSNESVPVPAEWIHLVEVLESFPVTANDISKFTVSDPILSVVFKFIREGWPNKVPPEFQSYLNKFEDLSVQGDCIMWGYRVVIPSKLRDKMLRELHNEHVGSTRMKELARSYFWWPNLDLDIEAIVRCCDVCLTTRNAPPHAQLHPWEWPRVPWHRIHADYAGPIDGTYFLVIVDAHSKWPEIFATNSVSSTVTIKALRTCFARFGLPVTLCTDNGSCFTSAEFASFMSQNGIRHVTSSVHKPSTNGLAESMVKTFKNAYKVATGKDVQRKLDQFLFKYRITPHSTTGVPPVKLMFGRTVRTVFDLINPNNTDVVQYRVQNKQRSQKMNYDGKNPRILDLYPEDKVMYRNYGVGDKWLPGEIQEKTGPVSYKCVTKDGHLVKRHQDQLIERDVNNSLHSELQVDDQLVARNVPEITDPVVAPSVEVRRSGRVTRPPDRLNL